MNQPNTPEAQPPVTGSLTQEMTQSVTNFMNRVYRWMIIGIFITAVTAVVTSHYIFDILWYFKHQDDGLAQFKFVFYTLIFVQLALVMSLSIFVRKMNTLTAILAYLAYAFTTGLTTSFIFYTFTQSDISAAFFITTFAFIGLAAFGYFTNKDLRFIGTFCTMGLFGLVGIFLYALFDSSIMTDTMQLYTGIAGIVIFSGLTAYDSKKIRQLGIQLIQAEQQQSSKISTANQHADVLSQIAGAKAKKDDVTTKMAIIGALALYLDFINLFFSILRVMKK